MKKNGCGVVLSVIIVVVEVDAGPNVTISMGDEFGGAVENVIILFAKL